MQTRIQLKLARDPIRAIRDALRDHDYIWRDKFDLTFSLARLLGREAPSEWNEVLDETNGLTDFSFIVVRMHYMRIHGFSNDMFDRIVKQANIVLGDDLGNPEFLIQLFALTEFNGDQSFIHSFT
jgi:hypothetical protein